MSKRSEERQAKEIAFVEERISLALEAAKEGVITQMKYHMPSCLNVDLEKLIDMVLKNATNPDEGVCSILERYLDGVLNDAITQLKQEQYEEHFMAIEFIKPRAMQIEEQITQYEMVQKGGY